MNSKQLATVMRAISRKATVSTICKSTGMTRQTIYRTLRALEGAKVARIADWKHDDTGRAVEPVWGLGDAPPAPRRRMSNAEKQKAYRMRKKQGAVVMRAMVAAATKPATTRKARAG